MTASEKMAQRVAAHAHLTRIDERLDGRVAKSSLISLHDLLRLRERACAELQKTGFVPWPSPYATTS